MKAAVDSCLVDQCSAAAWVASAAFQASCKASCQASEADSDSPEASDASSDSSSVAACIASVADSYHCQPLAAACVASGAGPTTYYCQPSGH